MCSEIINVLTGVDNLVMILTKFPEFVFHDSHTHSKRRTLYGMTVI
jgi:hypothetical protein